MRNPGFMVVAALLACNPDVEALREKESGTGETAGAPTALTPETPAGQNRGFAAAAPGAGKPVPQLDAVSVPAGDLRGDAAKGKQLYTLYCSSCHGLTGGGDGPLAITLVPRPANHTDTAYMGSLSDPHLYQVIYGGGPAVGKSPLMAPWGAVVSDDQIRDLIAYVRTLSGT